jgi:uncharacterized protein YjbI with pentapeptide repeats
MADETHLAVLRQGVAAWNAWREAHADICPELASVSLRGLDLAGADLAGADLRMTDLRGTILSGATLNRANCAHANFFKTVLDLADLSGANLIGVRFLNCAQLMTTRNWQLAFRDPDLACGAPLPPIVNPAGLAP